MVKKLAALACLIVACGGKPATESTTKTTTAPKANKPAGDKPSAGPNELYDRLGGQRVNVAGGPPLLPQGGAHPRGKPGGLQPQNPDSGGALGGVVGLPHPWHVKVD